MPKNCNDCNIEEVITDVAVIKSKLDEDRFNKIEEKLDDINKSIGDIKTNLAENTIVLEEHQRRSIALENIVEVVKTEQDKFKGAMQFVGILATLITVIGALYKIWR